MDNDSNICFINTLSSLKYLTPNHALCKFPSFGKSTNKRRENSLF
jgi:hypothetical protein